MMLAEPVEPHVSEANVNAAPASGRNPFGQPLFVIE
jgi:hypothetical protein